MSKKSIAEIFIEEAMRTNTGDYSAVIERISNPKTIKLAHAIIGMATEAGELLDALKKHIIYGKPLDEVNLIEECGDSNWYQALLLNTIGKTFEECMVANIQKLRKRYSDRFTEDEALNRNLEVERATLEEEFEGTITTNKILHELTENVVDRVKMEIVEDMHFQNETSKYTACGIYAMNLETISTSNSLNDVTCIECKIKIKQASLDVTN